jgi:hypothetical protein
MRAESSEWSRYGPIVRDILLHKAAETFAAHEVAEWQDEMLSEESISSQVLTRQDRRCLKCHTTIAMKN